jgi:hypothetical protein
MALLHSTPAFFFLLSSLFHSCRAHSSREISPALAASA